jgi:uncharacterized protein (DUF885 family)
MMKATLLGVSVLTLAIGACATAPVEKSPQAAAAVAAVPEKPQPTASERLKKLFADSDEGDLKLSPISALFRGDLRYADQFGDYITDAYLATTRAKAQDELKNLLAIDRAALSSKEQIAYDVFRYQTEFGLSAGDKGLTPIFQRLPIDHFNGVHAFFPDLSSGQGAAPFKTVADYDNNLKRWDGFVLFLDRATAMMRDGMAQGYVQPKIVTENVIGQLDTQLKMPMAQNPYMMPVASFPKDFSDADKARLSADYKKAMTEKMLPAYTRLRDFMAKEYLPASRAAKPGLISMKDGDKVYGYLIEQHTTTKMLAEEIHQIGLGEVARILNGMEQVKKTVGFKGSLTQFFNHIRTDAKFKFKTRQALIDSYWDVDKKLKAEIPKLFSLVPKSPLEIRAVPDYLEKNQAGAYYQSGTPDGSRPGVFYVNTYDLPSRTSPGVETLFLHEAIPGHHFQISLAQEDESLPPFMRFGGNTAYVEGWALYAESLGTELGLFTDPYQLQGRYDDEMLRAMRLVVDTGLHAKGWTREQAIKYMLDNSAMGKTDATSEVERYIAIPGQALAYKIGQLKIRALRTRAETALGDKFDIRGFHAEVLGTGALPLAVLESKIDAWIAAKK